MKNIKIFLPLYLGCRAKTTGGKFGKIVSVSLDGTSIIVYDNEDPRGRVIMQEAIIPILRPLSDITPEEWTHAAKIHTANGGKIEITISEPKDEVWEVNLHTNIKCYPETFRYFLEKHFDVFGMIDAGLAIDKTTLK